jgi:hypothetical protein
MAPPSPGGGFLGTFFLLYSWRYFRIHASTAVSKENPFTLRQVISQYALEHQMKPLSFDDPIKAGYLSRYPPVCLRTPSSDG